MEENNVQTVDATQRDGGGELSLEEAFSRMDELLNQLSDKDVSLDDSFAAYAEGVRLLKYCNSRLDRVEKQMMKLNEEGVLDEL